MRNKPSRAKRIRLAIRSAGHNVSSVKGRTMSTLVKGDALAFALLTVWLEPCNPCCSCRTRRELSNVQLGKPNLTQRKTKTRHDCSNQQNNNSNDNSDVY